MKALIRKEMLAKRKVLTFREVETVGELVFENLLKIQEFVNAKSCFCYWDFKNEVPTIKIREYFKNKILLEPVIDGDIMVAVKREGVQSVYNGYGIEEPQSYTLVEKSADISIIPLVACDKNGNRIGFGKGYYDKYLTGRNTVKIGICYSWQILDFVPKFENDIKLDYIVSEQQIIKVK